MIIEIKKKLAVIPMRVFQLLPIENKKVVFSSYFGKQYSDNPRFISEKLQESKDVDIVWILPSGVKIPNGIRTVKPFSIQSIKELATAKVWVDNTRKSSWIRKRKKQFYIQTWHGGVCLKAVEKDAENTLSDFYVYKAKRDSKMADLFVSECEWRTNNYRKAFWYTGDILKVGLPRSDMFYRDSIIYQNLVYDYYSIHRDCHVALYAPTFRRDHKLNAYSLDTDKVIKALENKFGGEWVIIIRLHPNIAHLCESFQYDEKVMNGTNYPEMNELLIASDVLISDYSGCIFDGLRIHKKVFLYAADAEEYQKKERNLYFDLANLPAPLAQTNDELLNNIMAFDENEYTDEIDKFNEKIGYYGQGNATEIIASLILERLNQ